MKDNVPLIYENDRGAIDRADLVVASLNGLTTDDGTAWEIGYAVARGVPVIGLHTRTLTGSQMSRTTGVPLSAASMLVYRGRRRTR